MTIVKRAFLFLLAIFVLLSLPRSVLAATVAPLPIIFCLRQGYGVVWATVSKATLLPQKSVHPSYDYQVAFTINDVLAQPTSGDAIPAKSGDVVTVPLPVGYSAPIEDRENGTNGGGPNAERVGGPLAPGTRYLLKIKYNPNTGSYEHAWGGGAAQQVKEFAAEEKALVVQTRALAALPPAEAHAKERLIVADPQASDALRSTALGELEAMFGFPPDATKTLTAEQQIILDFLHHVWNDAHANCSYGLLEGIDWLLGSVEGDDWKASEERERVWLPRIFAPLVADKPGEDPSVGIQRSKDVDSLLYTLKTLGKARPATIGARIMVELPDPEWTLEFKARVAGILQEMYQTQESPNPAWATYLQTFYPRTIETAPDSFALRWIAMMIQNGRKKDAFPDRKRDFNAGPATQEALTRALARMPKGLILTGENGGMMRVDSEAASAIEDALKALAQTP